MKSRNIYTFVFLVLLGYASIFQIASAQLSGHINMWSFDEGGNRVIIDGAGSADGTISGDALTYAVGKIGSALHFSGAIGEEVKLPDNFLYKSEGTLGTWVKLDMEADSNIIFSANSTADPRVYMLLAVNRDGQIILRQRSSTTGAEQTARSIGTIDSGVWKQVIFAVKDGRYKLYVGGTVMQLTGETEGKWFSNFTNDNIEYRIGASVSPLYSGVFRGTIDDLCFFNHGFTDDEATLLVKLNAEYIAKADTTTVHTILNPSKYVVEKGGGIELIWDTMNATSCTASGGWEGTKPTSGKESINNITYEDTYFLTCEKAGLVPDFILLNITIDYTKNTPTTTKVVAQIPTPINKPVITHTNEPVLPEGCSEYLTTYLKKGAANKPTEVTKLQTFLNEVMDARLPVTGYFGNLTFAWVKKFQVRYHKEIIKPWVSIGYDANTMGGGTGYVYKTTRYQINLMKCASLNAPKPELEKNSI